MGGKADRPARFDLRTADHRHELADLSRREHVPAFGKPDDQLERLHRARFGLGNSDFGPHD